MSMWDVGWAIRPGEAGSDGWFRVGHSGWRVVVCCEEEPAGSYVLVGSGVVDWMK